MSSSAPELRPAEKAGDSHFVQANGLRFHYLSWGDPSSPPLLMFHGGGQTAHTWQRVANRLSDRYFILAPDLRGHGDTEWAPDGAYTQVDMRNDIVALAEALGIEGFVLVGMSMGGICALNYAAQHSRRLRGLVVVDVSPAVEEAGALRIQNFLSSKLEFDTLDDVIAHARAFNPRRSPENLRRTLPANLRTVPNGKLAWKWDPVLFGKPGGRLEERRANQERLWQEAPGIVCPVLVVHGQESDILTYQNGEKLAGTVPNGRFVSIAGAGHSVQGDNPHSLAEALEQFLSDIGY
jgi:non-heme chloroperoxidase